MGDFVDLDGNFLGRHIGLPYYTIGQKRGLNLDYNLSHVKKYSGQSLVVFSKNVKDNSIALVPQGHDLLKTNKVFFRNKSSIFSGDCLVRTSNLGNLKPAKVLNDHMVFDQAQNIVAPGQYLVFYDVNGVVLGNAIVV